MTGDAAAGDDPCRPPHLPPECTWWPGCGRPPRRGDVVPSSDGRRSVRLHGVQRAPVGTTSPLTDDECERLLRRLRDILVGRRPRRSGADVLRAAVPGLDPAALGDAAGTVPPPPSVVSDRAMAGRAVRRWTARVLGRAVQRRVATESLRRHLAARYHSVTSS